MSRIIEIFNTYIFGPALPIVIFSAGIFLIIKYGSFIFLKPVSVIKVLTKKNEKGGMSPLKTAILALASTLGVGNIVGVSTAIYSGGAGAVFWLTISAVVAMAIKYGEVVLAVKYRVKNGGEYRGGAMYYMKDCLNNKRLSIIFAILCILNALMVGNIVQINAVKESVLSVMSVRPVNIGLCMAIIIFISICRGTKRISSITAKIIPFATVVYTLLSVYIIIMNIGRIGEIIQLIIKEAFSVKAISGGIGGYAIVRSVRYGVARGIMSNEAGSGTSPIAHAKTDLKSPVEQGFWGIFEVFADTVVMCNLTAFVILLSYKEYVCEKGLTGMELVLRSYGRYAGKTAEMIIIISILMFAYATVICQGFYGRECVYYLSEKKTSIELYTITYCIAAVVGSVISSELLWGMTDFNISLMTVINTVCILIASGEIKKATDEYFKTKKGDISLPEKSTSIQRLRRSEYQRISK